MTSSRVSNAFRPVISVLAGRVAPNLARADVFNRLYIVAMFFVIIAIGSFGLFALTRSQQSGDAVQRSFEHANDASEMGIALDREYAELLSQMNQQHVTLSSGFLAATRMFEEARGEIQRDGWANGEPLSNTLAPRHAAFVADSRAILDAVSSGDRGRALRIEADRVRPNVSAIRHALERLSFVSYRASIAQVAKDGTFDQDLKRLITSATLLGIALMVGFAMLLGRYKRSAVVSAAATLAAFEKAALTDNLTELGNNRSFYDDFEREIARAKRHDHPMVLALLDVDDFKAVNDNGGHSYGDAVLARVGERLRGMRGEDRGYRIGGDEFAIILPETGPEQAVLALARLQAEIRECGLGVSVSIGYVDLAGAQLGAESYELADAALYEAKRLGRDQTICFGDISNTVHVFSPRKAAVVRKMIVEKLVSTAFQPIWDVQSTRPLGFEALARPLPELGLSGPQEAFDIAQRIRQLPELDMLCTQKSLESAASLPAGSVIFLNYSPASLTHASFDPQVFVDMVRTAGLAPGQIVIEVTERRIENPAAVAERAHALQALGIRIALDDTGSGHAGLEILSKVRFDYVKIDRGLIIEAMDHPEARSVLAGIIAIARETRSYLIAEGIENEPMLDFVRDAHAPRSGSFAGIRGIQGFLLGRPESGHIDLRLLEEHHDFLAARQIEGRSTSHLLEVVRGEDGTPTPERARKIAGRRIA